MCLDTYAVSSTDRTRRYGRRDRVSITLLRANRLILAIDGDASCREEVLEIKTWLVATKTGMEW